MPVIRLVVGLGNAGPGLEDHRHSAGFWFVRRLAQDVGLRLDPDDACHGSVCRLRFGSSDCWLLKPAPSMDASGMAVLALMQRHQILPDEILAIHDEPELLPGTVRLARGGGDAAHEGLRDLIHHLATAEFWRLRIGVGHPGADGALTDYLLQPPVPEELRAIDHAIDRALLAWPLLQAGQGDAAMLALHTDPGGRPRSRR